jgi:methylthioribose-1-phosphate isomerase
MYGINSKGTMERIRITPKNAHCKNYSFDVTPAKYITKIITEKKIVDANESSISDLKF